MGERVCAVCGGAIPATRHGNTIICSAACRRRRYAETIRRYRQGHPVEVRRWAREHMRRQRGMVPGEMARRLRARIEALEARLRRLRERLAAEEGEGP